MMRRCLFVLTTVALMSGVASCGPLGPPKATPTPTSDVGAIQTEAAQAAFATVTAEAQARATVASIETGAARSVISSVTAEAQWRATEEAAIQATQAARATPTPTPTSQPTSTPKPTETFTPIPTATTTNTATAAPTPTNTPEPVPTLTATNTAVPVPTRTAIRQVKCGALTPIWARQFAEKVGIAPLGAYQCDEIGYSVVYVAFANAGDSAQAEARMTEGREGDVQSIAGKQVFWSPTDQIAVLKHEDGLYIIAVSPDTALDAGMVSAALTMRERYVLPTVAAAATDTPVPAEVLSPAPLLTPVSTSIPMDTPETSDKPEPTGFPTSVRQGRCAALTPLWAGQFAGRVGTEPRGAYQCDEAGYSVVYVLFANASDSSEAERMITTDLAGDVHTVAGKRIFWSSDEDVAVLKHEDGLYLIAVPSVDAIDAGVVNAVLALQERYVLPTLASEPSLVPADAPVSGTPAYTPTPSLTPDWTATRVMEETNARVATLTARPAPAISPTATDSPTPAPTPQPSATPVPVPARLYYRVPDGDKERYYAVDLDTGQEYLLPTKDKSIGVTFLPDGQSILLIDGESPEFTASLVNYVEGTATTLATGEAQYWSAAVQRFVSGDRQRIVLVARAEVDNGSAVYDTSLWNDQGKMLTDWEGTRFTRVVFSPDNQIMAYWRTEGDQRQLHISDRNGENPLYLAASLSDRGYGDLSFVANGRRLVYSVRDGDGAIVYAADRDGGNRVELCRIGDGTLSLRTSTLTGWVLCTMTDSPQGDGEPFARYSLVNAFNGERRIRSETVSRAVGTFSQDGRILALAVEPKGQPVQLSIVDLDSVAANVLETDNINFGTSDNSLSPDATWWVASAYDKIREAWGLYVLHADGSPVTELVSPTEGFDWYVQGMAMPDGQHVLAGCGRQDGRRGLFVMNRDGSHRVLLGDGPIPTSGMSLDGRDLYFAAERDGTQGIYRTGPDGSDTQLLYPGGEYAWLDPRYRGMRPRPIPRPATRTPTPLPPGN